MIKLFVQYFLGLLLLTSGLSCLALEESPAHFGLMQIATNIYVHRGIHAGIDEPGHDDIANIGFIIGNACVAVIDTGGSYKIGLALRQAISAVTDKPVCYVINTHIHYDHVLGNLAFKSDATKYIGHADLSDAIVQNRPFFLKQFGNELGEKPSEDSIIGPDITVSDTMDLDLGDRLLTLTAYKPAHSFNDLTVFDHKTGTLWLSDLLFMERIPALDGSLKGWLDTLGKLKHFPAARVIPGHGPATADWPAAMEEQYKYLTILLNQTREMIAAGNFMEDVIDKVGLSEKDNWELYEQQHRRNVSKAFTELEWE